MGKSPDPKHSRRRRGFVQTGALLSSRIRGVGERRGFAETRLLTNWDEICGTDLAAIASPLKISYARDGFGATLSVACEGAHAPEVQMQAPVIRERVNACYGYNAISRVRIVQKDAAGFAETRSRYTSTPSATGPVAQPAASNEVMGVADPDLRQALAMLEHNISVRKRDRGIEENAI